MSGENRLPVMGCPTKEKKEGAKMLCKRKGNQNNRIEFDKENQKAVLRCSICNREQVAGFKDIRTGKFQEVMVIRSGRDLDDFRQMYGLEDVPKEY